MVMLYISFKIPWLAAKFVLRGRDGKVDPVRTQRVFTPQASQAIADFPGLIWKVWAISDDARTGTGYYLFNSRADAQARADYAKKYYPRDGLFHVRCQICEVLEDCSRVTRAPIDLPANPGITPEKYAKLCSEHRGIDLAKMLFKK
jgi:hypothetical protein